LKYMSLCALLLCVRVCVVLRTRTGTVQYKVICISVVVRHGKRYQKEYESNFTENDGLHRLHSIRRYET
jgi:hypothetical protein